MKHLITLDEFFDIFMMYLNVRKEYTTDKTIGYNFEILKGNTHNYTYTIIRDYNGSLAFDEGLNIELNKEDLKLFDIYLKDFIKELEEGKIKIKKYLGTRDKYNNSIMLRYGFHHTFKSKNIIDITKEAKDYYINLKNTTNCTNEDLSYKFIYDLLGCSFIDFDKIKVDLNNLPKGIDKYQYQEDAVKQLINIIENYGIAFLADVVGLGKTIIACLFAKQIKGPSVIICPPHIMHQWKDRLKNFGFEDDYIQVLSYGKLNNKFDINAYRMFKYVFVDEAHIFRNANKGHRKDGRRIKSRYEVLKELCQNKKVILISATPYNNNVKDIKNLLDLGNPNDNMDNIYEYFEKWKRYYSRTAILDREQEKYMLNEIKDNSIRPILLRRTRADIRAYYGNDVSNLNFPEPQDPIKLNYYYGKKIDNLITETLNTLILLNYSVYKIYDFIDYEILGEKLKENPQKYRKLREKLENLRQLGGNLSGLIKALLFKRLDSSFYAFKKTLSKVKKRHNLFLKILKEGYVLSSFNDEIYDIDSDEELTEYLLQDNSKFEKYEAEIFSGYNENGISIEEGVTLDNTELTKILKKREKIDDHKCDTKFDTFINNLEKIKGKVIIFSENKDTLDYLKERINTYYKEKCEWQLTGDAVFVYSGESTSADRKNVVANFDPDSDYEVKFPIKYLLATDTLSEGINLHASNVIINYDIPWNPTIVQQRFGRVNRIRSKFNKIYIYNFFPIGSTNNVLDIDRNILKKIRQFIDLLGNDAKHLTKQEGIESQEIFEKVNDKDYYDFKNEYNSDELKLLKKIRDLRDSYPDKYEIVSKINPGLTKFLQDEEGNKYVISYINNNGENNFYKINAETSTILNENEVCNLINNHNKKIGWLFKINEEINDLIKENETYLTLKRYERENLENIYNSIIDEGPKKLIERNTEDTKKKLKELKKIVEKRRERIIYTNNTSNISAKKDILKEKIIKQLEKKFRNDSSRMNKINKVKNCNDFAILNKRHKNIMSLPEGGVFPSGALDYVFS